MLFCMIQLKNVLPHHLFLRCRCNHSRMVAVIELVETYGENITLDQVRKNARCTACKCKGGIEIRLVYVGGSEFAMRGSNTKEKE